MPKKLWEPSEERIKSTNIYRFMTRVNDTYGTSFTEYTPLWEWSVDHLEDFWAEAWKFLDIKVSVPYGKVIQDKEKMPGARFFVGSKLNFAENLLRFRDDRTALVFRGEDTVRRTLTYNQLFSEVAQTAAALKAQGVKPGDRVVGFVPNMPESIIAMLAATSLGAIWSSCSPDFGIKGSWTGSARPGPRYCSPQTGISSKASRSPLLSGSPASWRNCLPLKNRGDPLYQRHPGYQFSA